MTMVQAAAPITGGGGAAPVTTPAAAAAAAAGSRGGGSSRRGGQQGPSYDYWQDTPSAGMALGVLKTWAGVVYLKGMAKKRR